MDTLSDLALAALALLLPAFVSPGCWPQGLWAKVIVRHHSLVEALSHQVNHGILGSGCEAIQTLRFVAEDQPCNGPHRTSQGSDDS
jgi:hypothetical protein